MRNFLLFFVLILIIFIRYVSTKTNYVDGQKVRITGKITTVPIKYPSAQRIEIAGLKTDSLLESFDFERGKRSRMQYNMTEEIKDSKAKTSFERAKSFVFEMEKLLER